VTTVKLQVHGVRRLCRRAPWHAMIGANGWQGRPVRTIAACNGRDRIDLLDGTDITGQRPEQGSPRGSRWCQRAQASSPPGPVEENLLVGDQRHAGLDERGGL